MKNKLILGAILIATQSALALTAEFDLTKLSQDQKKVELPHFNFKKEHYKKLQPKMKVGGQDGNGGDTALDPKTQKRALLDLVEQDELNYFIPNSLLYEHSIPLGLAHILQRMRSECNSFNGEPTLCPQKPNPKQELVMDLADYSFMYVVIRSYGFKTLITTLDQPIYSNDYVGFSALLQAYVPNPEQVKPLKWAFVNFDLKEINDEGAVRIENPETKKQLAIQLDGLVVINQTEFDSLDKVSQASLFLHEAVLRAAIIMLVPEVIQEKGTEPIRTFTRRLVKYLMSENSKQKYPAYGVREAYDNLAN